MRAQRWENSPFGDSGQLFEGSGGSSITQQLVKNVYIPATERQERSIDRKLKETVYALELTKRYEKTRILEWYVNQISYGGVFNGVEAAAQGYFGKPASELTLAEAALMAGIPQSPAAYDPVTHPDTSVERRNEVLDLMLRQSPIQIGEDKFFSVTEAEVERGQGRANPHPGNAVRYRSAALGAELRRASAPGDAGLPLTPADAARGAGRYARPPARPPR